MSFCFSQARSLLCGEGRSLALCCSASLQRIVLVRYLRACLVVGLGVITENTSELLLCHPELLSELVGIPLGQPGALSVESSSRQGFLIAGGHRRVRPGKARMRNGDLVGRAVRTGTPGTGQALHWSSTYTVCICTVCTPGQPVTQPPGSLRLSYLAVSLIHL